MVQASTVAKCLTSVASLGCLIGGIVLLEMSSQKVHEDMAAEMVNSIDAWKSYREDFSQLPVFGSFDSSGTISSLPATVMNDVDRYENAADLPSYQPLAYRLANVPRGFLPALRFSKIAWEEVATHEHHSGLVRFVFQISGFNLSTKAFPLIRAKASKEQRGMYHNCRRRKGSFNNGKCWTYSKLSKLCVQIRRDGLGWSFAPRVHAKNDSYGCEYANGNWTATSYKEVDLVPLDASSQVVSFKDIDIVVRSAHDPFLKALEVTAGTLDFGMTSEEERWLALILVIMSVMLAVPPACALGNWYCKHRASKRPRRPQFIRAKSRKPDPDPEMVGMKYAVGNDVDDVYEIR